MIAKLGQSVRHVIEVEEESLVRVADDLLQLTLRDGPSPEGDRKIIMCHRRLAELEAERENPEHVIIRNLEEDIARTGRLLANAVRAKKQDVGRIKILRARITNLTRQQSRQTRNRTFAVA